MNYQPLLDNIPSFDLDKITKGTVLGKGEFGMCRKVFVKIYGICAMKIVNSFSEEELINSVRNEMLNHHPSFVSVFGLIHSNEVPQFTDFLMEYMEGGTLNGIFGKNNNIGMKMKIQWSWEIATGLAYLHEKKIMHKDLRPENIFLTTDLSKIPKNLCLSDIGVKISVKLSSVALSSMTTHNADSQRHGTLWYMAPEVIESEGKIYDFPADVFSLALTVNSIFTERRPFCDEPERWTESDHISRLLGMKPSLSTRPPIPFGLGQLEGIIKNCWLTIPERRMKMEEVCDLLEKSYEFGKDED